MALCPFCKRDMALAETVDCSWNRTVHFVKGGEAPAVPWQPPDGAEERCPDCNVAPGGFHHPGCDQEPCPRCGGQMISCDCH